MASPSTSSSSSSLIPDQSLSLLPLKPGDHLWRNTPQGEGTWHALYVGQFVLGIPDGSDTDAVEAQLGLRLAPSAAEAVPSVITVMPQGFPNAGMIARMPLVDFAGKGSGGATEGAYVRLYTQRPRGRREAVARALRICGQRVDVQTISTFPSLLAWWSIFDELEAFQPGLCATRAKAVRYRHSPKGAEPVQPALLSAVMAGGAVVRKGRVVLRGVRLMKVLRLTRAAGASWANLGGFVGQAIAANVLDDGDLGTSLATTAGSWAGGLAGGGAAVVAASTVGAESLGAGSLVGGLVVCSSVSALGAVAGAGLAYAAKKAIDRRTAKAEVDRTSEYYDCSLRLVGDADDVFNLFDATLEFPPEDAGFLEPPSKSPEGSPVGSSPCGGGGGGASPSPASSPVNQHRVTAAGWYAVRVEPGAQALVDEI